MRPLNEWLERKPVWYCKGKKCYTKKDAQTAKNARERDGEMSLRIYHHAKCNMWHLTHKNTEQNYES